MEIYVGKNTSTSQEITPEEKEKRSFMKLPSNKKFGVLYDSMVDTDNFKTEIENFKTDTENFKTDIANFINDMAADVENFINDMSPRSIKIVRNLDDNSLKRIIDDVEQENIINDEDYAAFISGAPIFIEYYEDHAASTESAEPEVVEELIFTERINKYLNNYKLNKNAFTGQVFLGYEEMDEKRYIKVVNYSLSMYDNTFINYEYLPLYDNVIPEPEPDPEPTPDPEPETKVLRFENDVYTTNDSIYDDHSLIMSDPVVMYLDDEPFDSQVFNNIVFNSNRIKFFKWEDGDNMYHFGLKNESDEIAEDDVTFTLNITGKMYSASTHVKLVNKNYTQQQADNETDTNH